MTFIFLPDIDHAGLSRCLGVPELESPVGDPGDDHDGDLVSEIILVFLRNSDSPVSTTSPAGLTWALPE